MAPESAYVFLDIESSGLDPKFDVILELGMIITDKDLNELAVFDRVINWQSIEYDQVTGEYTPPFGVHKIVTEMHDKSGLWKESYRSPTTLYAAIADAAFWLGQQLFDTKEKVPLCGNTIGFDRSFLAEADPKFLELFHYRSVDLSSVKILYNDWYDVTDQVPPVGNKLHRSVPDCYDSINEAKFYKKVLFT